MNDTGSARAQPITVATMAIWKVSTSGSSTLRRSNTKSQSMGQKRSHSGLLHTEMNEPHSHPDCRAAYTVAAARPAAIRTVRSCSGGLRGRAVPDGSAVAGDASATGADVRSVHGQQIVGRDRPAVDLPERL